jgi:hemerythrin
MLKLNPEWTAGTVELDQEHEKFFEIATRLLGLVRVDVSPHIVREALETLYQRLALHTAAEERLALKHDREAAAILREDHLAILEALKSLSRQVGQVDASVVVAEMERIVAMIDKHEREVDVPLFRMMANR